MKTKKQMQHLSIRINNEIERIDMGYEMGCLISSEFTPAPNYDIVLDILGDKQEQLFNYLAQQAEVELSEIRMELSGVFQRDSSYTQSGHLLQFLDFLLSEQEV